MPHYAFVAHAFVHFFFVRFAGLADVLVFFEDLFVVPGFFLTLDVFVAGAAFNNVRILRMMDSDSQSCRHVSCRNSHEAFVLVHSSVCGDPWRIVIVDKSALY